MSKQTRTIGLLALAGLFVFAAAAFVVLSDSHQEQSVSGDILVSTRTLPADHTVDGEARIGNTLHALIPVQGGLTASGTPDAVTLRLRDAHARYYDMTIGRTIALAGLAPKTQVSVFSGGSVLHDGIPADWNGRIVLDTPATVPFDISFTQNDHRYLIGIMAQIGGAL